MYTNETTHYSIPKPLGTDLTVPMDYNDAADAVDEALFNASTNASEAVTAAANAVDAAADALEEVGNLGTDVNSLTGRTSALESSDIIQNNKIDALENQGATKFDSVGIADAYVNGLTYSVGDVVTYNGQRYKCTTAVVAAEPFDADKWSAEDVESVLNELKSDLTANVFGTTVDITSYIGNIYTFPSDGYVKLHANTDGTNTCLILGNVLGAGSDNTPRATFEAESKAQSGGDRWASLYVKKGMRFSCSVTGTSAQASTYFVPIE